MPDIDQIFHDLISLVGKEIEVGLRSKADAVRGTVVYTMFDSFLIETNGGRRVIAFDDINYLTPLDAQQT
jgi:hypothetical protein